VVGLDQAAPAVRLVLRHVAQAPEELVRGHLARHVDPDVVLRRQLAVVHNGDPRLVLERRREEGVRKTEAAAQHGHTKRGAAGAARGRTGDDVASMPSSIRVMSAIRFPRKKVQNSFSSMAPSLLLSMSCRSVDKTACV